MVYYCSLNDVGSRLGLNNAQRSNANNKINSGIRRASIDINQEFKDYGRIAPSREQGESTTSAIANVKDTAVSVVNANDFATAGEGNIDGESFAWTGKNGGVSALTIANAGANYQAGTLSATGGTGSGFTGTYGISATTASYNIGGTNTTVQAGNLLVNGVSKGAYPVKFKTASYSVGGTNTTARAGNLVVGSTTVGSYTVNAVVASVSSSNHDASAVASDGSTDGSATGNFLLNGATGGTFTISGGVIQAFTVTSTTKFASAPTISVPGGSNQSALGNGTHTAVLSVTGQIQSISVSDNTYYTSAPTLSSSTTFGNGTVTVVLATTGQLQSISVNDTTKYPTTPTITSSSSFGNATINAVLNNTGIISSTVISSAGIYTVTPTAIVISHSGDNNASITSAFTYTKLTGVSNISADHASGVPIQDGEMAHVLREICADLAAAYYMEDEGSFYTSGESLRGNNMRERGIQNLRRLAHLGSVN